MKISKNATIKSITLLLLSIVLFVSMGGQSLRKTIKMPTFSALVRREELQDISLTIYYMSPYIMTAYPWGVEQLTSTALRK